MKANKDIRLLLHINEIYAYELFDELGICQSTYTAYMRKELPREKRLKFFEAIERIKERKRDEP